MSEPYVPSNAQQPYPRGSDNTVNPAPGTNRVREVHSTVVSNGSGLGVGLLVALVFVVVAVLAYAFYEPGRTAAPVSTTIEQSSGGITIDPVTPEGGEVEAAPGDAPAAAAPAPAEPAPAAPAPAAPANP